MIIVNIVNNLNFLNSFEKWSFIFIKFYNFIPNFFRRQVEKRLGFLRIKIPKLTFCRNTLYSYIILIFSLYNAANCSSGEVKDTQGSEKKNVISAFQILSSADSGKDDSAARQLERALDSKPELFNDPELIQMASDLFLNKSPVNNCEPSIEEPNEQTYVMNGFESPLKIKLKCSSEDNPVLLQLTSEKSVRFKSKSSSHDSTIKLKIDPKNSSEFEVSGLSMTQAENKILFSTYSRYKPQVVEILKQYRVTSLKGETKFTPLSYQLKSIPTAYSREYEQYVDRMFKPKSVLSLTSKNMAVSIAPNGVFTMGGEEKGTAFDLLYGHPNNAYADSHGTSFTTIKVDDENYKFNELEDIIVKSQSTNEVVIEGKLSKRGIVVQQVFTKNSIRENVFKLSYRVFNKSKADCTVGIRVLLDTWAGDNDGVPFAIPSVTGKEKSIYEEEMKFTSAISPIWETVDTQNRGTIFIRNTMIGDGLNPPDYLIFANWPTAYNTTWEYEPDQGRSITGDSAILAYWNPRALKSGGSYSIATEYSYVKKENKLTLELLDSEKGTALLSIDKTNPSQDPLLLKYTLEISSGKISSDNGTNKLEFTVKEGEKLTRVVPILLQSFGDVTVNITEVEGKKSNKHTFSFTLTGKGSSPGLWTSNKVPVSYVDEKSGLKLKGVFIDSETKKEIGNVSLKESMIGNGKYSYTGEIDIKDYKGRGSVVIEEIEETPKMTFDELPAPPAMGLSSSESYNLMDDKFILTGKIVNEFNGKYEIDLVKGTKTTVNQLLYVIDSNKRIIGKVKIKEINSDKAIASFQESFMDITPGMDSGIRNQ
jgi:hypothetical protein